MSEATKEYNRFLLVGGSVLVLEGILICLLSAAGVLVLDDPIPSFFQTPLMGIILGIVVVGMGAIFLLIILVRSKGWIKEKVDERNVKIFYKASFHAYFMMMFVAFNLILLNHFTMLDLVLTTLTNGILIVIISGVLAFLFSMIIQEFFQYSYR